MITIVAPLDGSKLSEAVLPHVENLASRLHAEVYFIQVIDLVPSPFAAGGDPRRGAANDQLEHDRKAAESYLSALAGAWQARDIYAKWEIIQGVPATSIVNFARSHKAYMIAMSTHGRSGLSRMVFGSVADEVMRVAGIPVLLVRPVKKAA